MQRYSPLHSSHLRSARIFSSVNTRDTVATTFDGSLVARNPGKRNTSNIMLASPIVLALVSCGITRVESVFYARAIILSLDPSAHRFQSILGTTYNAFPAKLLSKTVMKNRNDVITVTTKKVLARIASTFRPDSSRDSFISAPYLNRFSSRLCETVGIKFFIKS